MTCRIFSYSMGTVPLEKRMATHFSILTWQIAWAAESTGLQPVWSQSVSHYCESNIFIGNSYLWHVGSSFLTRDRTQAPCIGRMEF